MKLSPEQLGEIRKRYALGGLAGELADEYGVRERHVRRLVAGVRRDAPRLKVETTVEDAVVVFLDGLELDSADVVTAETLLLLARKLDRADSRTAPALADRLVNLCEGLRLRSREPDRIDELIARREARLLHERVARNSAER